jgi:hypothetical protein
MNVYWILQFNYELKKSLYNLANTVILSRCILSDRQKLCKMWFVQGVFVLFQTAAVKFNYIFSGCYLLEIGRIHDSVASMRMFIETEYKKVLLTQKIPRITNQYTTALWVMPLNNFLFIVTYNKKLHTSVIQIYGHLNWKQCLFCLHFLSLLLKSYDKRYT